MFETFSRMAGPNNAHSSLNSTTLEDLPLKKEKTYFILVAIAAVICWILIILSIVGIFYGVLIAISIWLGNGLLVAYLKSESVLVGPDQLPVLQEVYRQVADRLEVRDLPPLYVVQSHGVLNAFASRHAGRDFVVIFSDMLESCGEDSPQIRFILGHELGHIRRSHISKKVFLAPGLLVPLLGSAYCRACETSCDRHGAYVAGDLHAAAQALMILSGGRTSWREMNPVAFAQQHTRNRGFFVSWHELTSGYPTLSQRVRNILSMEDLKRQPTSASRHPIAYFFALFAFGGGSHGSAGNLIVTVVVVSLLASIAIPNFERARERAQELRAKSAHLQAVRPHP